MKWLMVAILMAAGFVYSNPAAAQTGQCASLRTEAGSPLNYRRRDNRCEGMYVADVATNVIELLSFTQGDLSYDLKPGVKLLVSAADHAGPLNIRAVAKPPSTHYQMDAVLEAGATLTWPVADVLLPEGLNADRVGIYGWRGREREKTFVPVQVKVQGSREAGFQRPSIFLSIRPSFDTELVKWRWAAENQGACSVYGAWNSAVHSLLDAGQPVKLVLRNLKGQVCIQVEAKESDSNDWSLMKIQAELP